MKIIIISAVLSLFLHGLLFSQYKVDTTPLPSVQYYMLAKDSVFKSTDFGWTWDMIAGEELRRFMQTTQTGEKLNENKSKSTSLGGRILLHPNVVNVSQYIQILPKECSITRTTVTLTSVNGISHNIEGTFQGSSLGLLIPPTVASGIYFIAIFTDTGVKVNQIIIN